MLDRTIPEYENGRTLMCVKQACPAGSAARPQPFRSSTGSRAALRCRRGTAASSSLAVPDQRCTTRAR